MDDKDLKSITQRVKRLEEAVFGSGKKALTKGTESAFSGATGGVRFLISKGYFKKKLDLKEVRSSLAGQDYHYSTQAVHEALKRLTSKDGPLVALREGGKKLYVKRK